MNYWESFVSECKLVASGMREKINGRSKFWTLEKEVDYASAKTSVMLNFTILFSAISIIMSIIAIVLEFYK